MPIRLVSSGNKTKSTPTEVIDLDSESQTGGIVSAGLSLTEQNYNFVAADECYLEIANNFTNNKLTLLPGLAKIPQFIHPKYSVDILQSVGGQGSSVKMKVREPTTWTIELTCTQHNTTSVRNNKDLMYAVLNSLQLSSTPKVRGELYQIRYPTLLAAGITKCYVTQVEVPPWSYGPMTWKLSCIEGLPWKPLPIPRPPAVAPVSQTNLRTSEILGTR